MDSNRDAIEKAVLSCLLRDPSLLAQTDDSLKESRFRDPLYARIFAAIVDLSNSGQRPDLTALVQKVSSTSQMAESDVAMVVADLLGFAPNVAHGRYYLTLLLEADEDKE
jgi:replicative DNA helicase